jgi:hypothetical protein
MPTLDNTISRGMDSEQINFVNAMLQAANSKVSSAVEPFLYETLSE